MWVIFFRTFPATARTFYGTPRKAAKPIEVFPGEYLHLGLANELFEILEENCTDQIPNIIQIDLATDGAKLNKEYCVWPILCRVFNVNKSRIGIVGIYVGKKQPNSSVQFFQSLVDEVREIKQKGGIMFKNKLISLQFRCFIADALARAFALNHKYCTAEKPCFKCHVKGVYYINKNKRKETKTMVYLGTNHDLRTTKEYEDRSDLDFYSPEPSALDNIFPKPLFAVLFEYMHLVLLGVMCKLLSAWLDGKFNRLERMSGHDSNTAARRLSLMHEYVPEEFARKPQDIADYEDFKATEFRQILLFDGIIIFRNLLSKHAYYNFLLFHAAIRSLCYYADSEEYLYFAKITLKSVHDQMQNIYTPAFMSYNVHGLLHLAKDAKRFGNLDSYSAFPFENVMGEFAKSIRKPDEYLEQISNRLTEIKIN